MERRGRYRLTRRLGQGGMAEVFEGVAEGEGGFRRRIAVKRILPHLANDPSCARMFLDEARIASQLHHANIVGVLDYGTVDGVPFQVLEFVAGLDLERLARAAEERGSPLPVGISVYIATQVAYALHHAHEARDERGSPLGIVHRDVSPANVLISWDGAVKLGDFGIALAENRLERTQNDGIKGKLEYMAPEQAVRGAVDRRADVFALGCTLHRLLSGKSPLADLSVLSSLLSGRELELDPEIDEPLRVLLEKATKSAQGERHATAGALGEALGALVPRYLHEEPSGALRRFLSGLRDETASADKPAKKRGALDMLLDLELVLAGEGDERAFIAERSTEIAKGATPAPPRSTRADLENEAGDSEALGRRPFTTSRRRTLALLSAGALSLAIGAALTLGGKGSAPAASLPEPSDPPPPRRSVAKVREVTELRPVALESDDAGAQTQATERSKPDPQNKKRKRSMPSTGPEGEAKTSARTASAAESRGTLVVGGEGAQRAELWIDGKTAGFAPKRVELATGEHVLSLVKPDGSRIGPHVVRIDASHTASAPAKWIVP